MTKSIYTDEYTTFVQTLKSARMASGKTQVQCAKELDRPQSFMSDVESGTRRLDVIQLRDLCKVFGISLADFVNLLEQRISDKDINHRAS